MIFVMLSAIIFGFVHPGSKLIMGQGIDLLSFCLLYVAIRLLVQIPVVIKTGQYRLSSRKQALTLVSIGVVGAILQLTEFMGIAKGLPVPIVTFLVYTHPVWTMALGYAINGDGISASSLAKMGLGIGGSAVIALGHLQGTLSGGLAPLIAPIFAGVMIALWVCLSAKAKKDGASTWTISFYYDLFAFTSLLLIRFSGLVPSMSVHEIAGFLSSPTHLILISAYSIFVGLLPNLLFYHGGQNISALSCGLILLLEPLVASLTANVAWNSPLPNLFVLGAGFVLLAGSPIENFPVRKLLQAVRSPKNLRIAARIACILLIPVSTFAESAGHVLHIVEIVPSEQSDYTVSKELESIDLASDLAVKDFKKLRPQCPILIKKDIARGTEEDLFSKVSKIASESKDSDMLVGMTRTSFARVAATAAKGSKLKAISIGAATANLAEINKRFFSIVSPWSSQWNVIENRLKVHGCTKERTFGYFDATDYLSRNFKTAFELSFGKENAFSIRDLGTNEPKQIRNESCLFIAVNFSQAQAPLSQMAKKNFNLTIFGIGDWNYYATELKVLLKTAPKTWQVSAPTGWTPSMSNASQEFERRFQKVIRETPSPVAAYTYDATIMALFSMCDHLNLAQLDHKALKKIPLLRDYNGIAESNNFTSPMQLVEFKGARPL